MPPFCHVTGAVSTLHNSTAPCRGGATLYDKQALINLIREYALEFGDFTLASGKKASFYLDCRKVTLHPRGANLIAEGILELLGDDLPQAVGGMAIGADPITAAVITVAGQQNKPIKGFIVRKESKEHGKGRDVEGPVEPGDTAVIVEDTTTTGGSSLKAIDKAEAAGLKVVGVISIVDRLAGAAEIFAERGYPLRSLLTIRDFGIEPETGE
ncbi:MAG: orotate phosphoribosyltransferase [Planctomycetaceae bacterium]|nr:orotate phosphoribosyltransferase [Planctomycetaceae bacterium]